MTAVSGLAVIRALITIFKRRSRTIPYSVQRILVENDEPYTIYYERMRTVEGLLLCAVGLYLITRLCSEPLYTFNGSFVLYLIFGFVFLTLGLPLCFICSGGCAIITAQRVIIYRTRCFLPRTLTAIPRRDIQCACRISAGRKGIPASFFAFLFALVKGDRERATDMHDAAFMSGYLEIRTENGCHRIRLSAPQAGYALSDIGALCESENDGGDNAQQSFFPVPPIVCTALALAATVIFGVILTTDAKTTVEKRYIDAIYLEETAAYSQAYVEFEHLAEMYNYRDSEFRAGYCYVCLEMSQGEYVRAVARLKLLPDFDEKNDLLYHCAVALSEESSASLAAEIFVYLGEYEKSAEYLAQIERVYNMSVAAYESGDYLTAAEGFSILRDYGDTTEYVVLLAEIADRLVPNNGNPENLNSAQILERCNEALPLLEILDWNEQCAELKVLCEEYIEVYTFD